MFQVFVHVLEYSSIVTSQAEEYCIRQRQMFVICMHVGFSRGLDASVIFSYHASFRNC